MSIVKIRTTLTQAQIDSHSIPRLDPIDSKSSIQLIKYCPLIGHWLVSFKLCSDLLDKPIKRRISKVETNKQANYVLRDS